MADSEKLLYINGGDPKTRYWVGGTGTWSDKAHWSATSGGSGGETVPTSSDDVYVDSNSGISGGTITINAPANLKSFISTVGSAYTVTKTFNYGMYIYGSLILENTINFAPQFVSFYGTDAGKVINTNGATLNTPSGIYFYSNGEWTLENDLVTTGEFQQDNGTFYGNGYNVTAKDFYFESYGDGNPWGLHMGSGTWTATIQGWYLDDWDSTMSFNCDTSTVKLLSSADYGDVNDFAGGGKTYNKLWWTGDSTNDYKIRNSNTFNEFKIDTPPHVVRFESGTTQTVNIFSVSGTAGNLITLDTLTGAGTFTLSKASGVVSCDYLNISRSSATGGASWYAGINSINSGDNSGWVWFDNSEKGLYSIANITTNSEKGLYIEGYDNSYSVRGIYLNGIVYSEYTKENSATLKDDDTSLGTVLTDQEIVDIKTENGVYSSLCGTEIYFSYLFKIVNTAREGFKIRWVGKSDIATTERAVYLQAYDQVSGEWVILDTDILTNAGGRIELEALINTDYAKYFDINNIISCRIYQ